MQLGCSLWISPEAGVPGAFFLLFVRGRSHGSARIKEKKTAARSLFQSLFPFFSPLESRFPYYDLFTTNRTSTGGDSFLLFHKVQLWPLAAGIV